MYQKLFEQHQFAVCYDCSVASIAFNVSFHQPQMKVNLDIPVLTGGEEDKITLTLKGGGQMFIVGANGSGKSALIQHFVSTQLGETQFTRIAAHRQTWIDAGEANLTPGRRISGAERRNRQVKRDVRARSIDIARLTGLVTMPAIALSVLMNQENDWARKTAYAVRNSAGAADPTRTGQSGPAPLEQLNGLLTHAGLNTTLYISRGAQLQVKHHNSSENFNIAEMSDGERNAAILAASVLIAKPDTVLLINEPERHLHRAIIVPFLSALFAARKDCAFVVSTHEIALPAANPQADVLMVRSCERQGRKPTRWDVQQLKKDTKLPERLRLDILGSRKSILYVEGDDNSLDFALYSALFPNLSIKPQGGNLEVIEAVRGLRKSMDDHHVAAFGLVDKDNLTADDVRKLAGSYIYALDVYSVEALYYCSDAIDAVAKIQAQAQQLDSDQIANSAKEEALTIIEKHGEEFAKRMSARICERRMRNQLMSKAPTWEEIQENTQEKIPIPSIDNPFNDELNHFKKLVQDKDLDALIKRYPLHKSNIPSVISKELLCTHKSNYQRIVAAEARKGESLAQSLKRRLDPLSAALEQTS